MSDWVRLKSRINCELATTFKIVTLHSSSHYAKVVTNFILR